MDSQIRKDFSIKSYLSTEKTQRHMELNKYSFLVNFSARKETLIEEVKYLFGLTGSDVKSINILNRRGKTKRFRGSVGTRSDLKIAIITISHGKQIDLDLLKKNFKLDNL